MTKTYGPLLSLDASGTLGDCIVFSKWKGRNYVRERIIPANPQSGPQTGMRAMLRFLSREWTNLTSAQKADWLTRAQATNISNFNAFVGYNQERWRHFLYPSKLDPATEAGTAPSAGVVTITAGIRQLTLSIADGANVPDWGWAIFRSLTTGFSRAFSNAIYLVRRTATPTVHVDTPLLTGTTYYYLVVGFMTTGLPGTVSVEASGTPN